jgi:hypothetical protein
MPVRPRRVDPVGEPVIPPAADAGGPEPAVGNVHQDERAVTVTPLPEPVPQPLVTEDVSALARKLVGCRFKSITCVGCEWNTTTAVG